ncbi:hypothetical protein G6F56_010641 [Rhizopus delemar]|nr:hypothetical protein G6F56_010641 [Rhizopus delemar]
MGILKHYFLILELLEGGEIFHQLVQLTYFSEDLTRHCIKQVAEGVRYLHEEKGVVHRDIKPENILFETIPFMERKFSPVPTQPENEDEPKEDEGECVPGLGGGGIGRVKLADFGLSKIVWDKQTMTPCGTVGYTAPEIVRDERYSKSVDMWALGCVMYTMLCGFPPFYDESIQTLTHKVAEGQYTFLSPWWDYISEDAKDLVSHLLEINPKKRYTIDQFLQHPWLNAWDTKEEISSESKISNLSVMMSPPPLATTSLAAETISAAPHMKRKDVFLSGIASMKEAFDVSYAVHRIGEERAYRKENKQRRNRWHMFGSRNISDDEDAAGSSENEVEHITSKAKQPFKGKPTMVNQRVKNTFDLNMNNATLLGRRGNHVPA